MEDGESTSMLLIKEAFKCSKIYGTLYVYSWITPQTILYLQVSEIQRNKNAILI